MEPNAAQPQQPLTQSAPSIPQTPAVKKPLSLWKFTTVLFAVLWIGTIVYFLYGQRVKIQITDDVLLTETTPTASPSYQPPVESEPTVSQPTMSPTPTVQQIQKASNYLPVKYVAGNPQKIGQTFELGSPVNASGIRLQGSYGAGTAIKLTLYKLNNPLDVKSGTVIATRTFDPTIIVKEKMFDVLFASPVVLEADTAYFFTVEPGNTLSDAGIGFEENGTLKNGTMHQFSRPVGGNGAFLSQTPVWYPRNTADVVYRLIDLTESAESPEE